MKALAKPKLIRTSTVAISLNYLLRGQLSFLDQYYEVISVSADDGHLKEVSRREGVRTLDLYMSRNINAFIDLKSLWQLYLLFRKEKPLIVHSITPKAGLLSMVAAYFARVPIRMHTFTGLIFPYRTGSFQKILILMDKILCFCATNIYPEGQGVKNDLIRYGITNKPLKIIANGNINGIDVKYFSRAVVSSEQKESLKKELKITDNDFVFIFVGRLVGDKGINELVKAFKELTNKNQKLLLVGPLETELDPLSTKTLEEIQNNPNIISVGFQDDVRQYLAISDALVFPSYREGFPNVPMQAGCFELPCIVTDINGCNEIIENEKNGLIIPVKNTEALKFAMKRMLNDKFLYLQLKENARKMIVDRYEQSHFWSLQLNEYQMQLKKLGIIC
jgi:glycosyltransferase involved in cell wall biosynthesis